MIENRFTWVETHKKLTEFLVKKENSQKELIELLKSVGISPFNDKSKVGDHDIELDEIDPFTFFCYIYKYGPERRLKYLQKIAEKLNINSPNDDSGIPSANAQRVWLFPFKYERVNNEIQQLWNFFKKAINNNITNVDFADVLSIRNVAKAKITEALFSINPEEYFPINGPTKPYLKNVLEIEPAFETYSDYIKLLENIKTKISIPFYELSYEAWKWNDGRSKVNYWVFQGNPKIYNVVDSLNDNMLTTWSVKAHEDKIKVGDKIILWVTGKDQGCYALGEVTSDVYEGLDEEDQFKYYTELSKNETAKRVKIKITNNLSNNPIKKDQIENISELKELKVGNQGTNFSATEEEYETLLELAKKHNSKKYWLYAPGENAELWDEFFDKGIMGLGWNDLGDLNNYSSKEEITTKLQELGKTNGSKKNDSTANYQFKDVISIGDIIIVKKGRGELLGYGVVSSNYFYDKERSSYQKCRKVEWKKKGNWKTEHSLALKTLTDITKYPSEHPDFKTYYERLMSIMGVENNTKDHMQYPLNTILYGPPGTGKTFNTVLRAVEIIENRKIDSYAEALKIFKANLHNQIEFITFHQNYSYEDFIQGLRPDTENDQQLTFERKDGVFKIIADKALKNSIASEEPPVARKTFEETFNEFATPLVEGEVEEIAVQMKKVSYFITAITNKSIEFRKASGGTAHTLSISTLRKMYDAESVLDIQGLSSYYAPLLDELLKIGKDSSGKKEIVQKKNYVIIIDEINRANISRVFGELITLIEPDKRSGGAIPLEARLPSGDPFIVPSNLYIIGTMNTADKSIALLDIALRRRFEFDSMYPKYEIKDHEIYDVDILRKINEQIIKSKGHDFQIGHAYFMGENTDLVQRMNKKVIPLLLEYYMNDEKEVKGILKSAGLIIEEDSWPIRITGKND
ncbi:EVE domain-containing protein [Flavobacterium sp.]|uniref:EVE domain-containing protein n=1 Tax=Flavobacterium sp. TaxID=239 RepID=UPI002C317943|nr:EVE domain-containing protein [Flavobacterium sp.]HSD07639.1 EVE domain-containing protein [Flavobacterium sp.]